MTNKNNTEKLRFKCRLFISLSTVNQHIVAAIYFRIFVFMDIYAAIYYADCRNGL